MAKNTLPFKLRIRCSNRKKDNDTCTYTQASTSKSKKAKTKRGKKGTSKNPKISAKSAKPSKSNAKPWTKISTTTNWRDQLKATDPAKYKQMLKQNADYKKMKRLDMAVVDGMLKKRNLPTEEKVKWEAVANKKKKYNQGCAERMKRYRALKKAKEQKEPPKPLTRTEQQKAREVKDKKAVQRREQRAAMTKAEKAKHLEIRRQQYAQSAAKNKLLLEEAKKLKAQQKIIEAEERRLAELKEQLAEEETRQREMRQRLNIDCDARRPEARRQSLQRVRKAMPKKATHYVGTHADLKKNLTPRKRAAFEKVRCDRSARKELDKTSPLYHVVAKGLAEKKNSIHRRKLASSLSILKKYKLQRSATRGFGVSRKLFTANKSTPGRKKISAQVVEEVRSFYDRHAKEIPDKKMVSKKTGKAASVIDHSISKLFHQFQSENPNVTVGLSTFFKLRPRHVKTKRQTKYRGCLCEYCENIALKLETINRHLPDQKIKDSYELVNMTLCGEKPHASKCIYRECNKCGVGQLNEAFQDIPSSLKVNWKRWDVVDFESVNKDGTKKTIKKRTLVERVNQDMATLMDEMKNEMENHAAHLFQKDWQHKQFNDLRRNLPSGTCACVLDFAENYKCSYQDEVQGAYWTQNSATVHPVVCYYRCNDCDKIITESMIFVSDDLTHDYHAVHAFQRHVHHHLTNARSLKLTTMYRNSDGCSVQYKSKGPFSDISHAVSDYGYPIEHVFAGSRHGKGPSDGESAVVKHHATQAVKTGAAVISNAEELYKYAKLELTRNDDDCSKHAFRRTCFYVPRSEISRERGDRCDNLKTVPGTQKLHTVKTISEGTVATRNLSCFCFGCMNDGAGCVNTEYVQEWKEHTFSKGSRKEPTPKPKVVNDDTPTPAHDSDDTAHSSHSVSPKPKATVSPKPNPTTKATASPKPMVTASLQPTSHPDVTVPVNSVPSSATSGNCDVTIQINDYVAVQFPRSGSSKDWVYMAMVSHVDDSYAQLEFMQRSAKGQYTFSSEPAASHPFSDVVMKMSTPAFIGSGLRFSYQFPEEELSTLCKDYILK